MITHIYNVSHKGKRVIWPEVVDAKQTVRAAEITGNWEAMKIPPNALLNIRKTTLTNLVVPPSILGWKSVFTAN